MRWCISWGMPGQGPFNNKYCRHSFKWNICMHSSHTGFQIEAEFGGEIGYVDAKNQTNSNKYPSWGNGQQTAEQYVRRQYVHHCRFRLNGNTRTHKLSSSHVITHNAISLVRLWVCVRVSIFYVFVYMFVRIQHTWSHTRKETANCSYVAKVVVLSNIHCVRIWKNNENRRQ